MISTLNKKIPVPFEKIKANLGIVGLVIVFVSVLFLSNVNQAEAEYLYSSSSCAASGSYSSYSAARGAVGTACSAGTGYSRNYIERATSYSWECTGWNGVTGTYVTTANCSVSWPAATAPSVPSCSASVAATPSTATPQFGTACGTYNNTSIRNGSKLDLNNETTLQSLCSPQSKTAGNTSFLGKYGLNGIPSYSSAEGQWEWVCGSNSNSSPLAKISHCQAKCEFGTMYCPATGICSSDCVDWCPDSIEGNPEGNQTDRNLYIIDERGKCVSKNLILKFDLDPAITGTNGTCKALWTVNPLSNTGNMKCTINGSPVSCTNTGGYGVQPGRVKLEVTLTEASSTISSSEELRCTRNPTTIEI